MNTFTKILISYIRMKFSTIITAIITLMIFITVFSLYDLPLESILYASILTSFFIIFIGLLNFRTYYRKHMLLENIKNHINISDYVLPKSKGIIEEDYNELLSIVTKNRLELINEKNIAYSDMMEYYTIWAHQIKTPISAMKLLIQSKKSELTYELLEQLFKVEQYVEMVLQYLRMENMSSDLLIKSYSLDSIVKQAIRKYSSSFIGKRIKLNYEDLNCKVLTDEKWLLFVIEQILSNALKYTYRGEISIYMDEQLPFTLVIEDTGIGIVGEDIPRIFEKGFTGFNGRSDKKSTGIGLYLCKKILKKLSHTILIESEIDKGTKVKIGLESINMVLND